MTADLVIPEDQVPTGDKPAVKHAQAPRVKPRPEPAPRSADRPVPTSAEDVYAVAEDPVAPPRDEVELWPVGPSDPRTRPGARPGGLHVPVAILVGGALGVALVLIVSFTAVYLMLRGQQPAADAPSALIASAPARAAAAAPAPTPAVKTARPPAAGTPSAPVAAPAAEISVADLLQAPAPHAPGTAPASAPTQAPAPAPIPEVSVANLAPRPDSLTPAPDLVVDSKVVAAARAGAAAVAARDDGAGKSLSTADIVAESEPSVALIKGQSSSGTGFLVAPDLVATNAHVIDDELISELEVQFVSADATHKAPLKAELLYEDADRDLAFLAVNTDLKPLRIARTYTFRKGEDITVIGNPGLGEGQVLENAISRGVMSTKSQIEGKNFYQLGIAINAGNSGGPVFDSSGRVIGVATLKAAKQEATGFSIPIEDFHAALAKVASESTADAERYRSRHRLKASVQGLGSGGAILCLLIDLRRADALTKNAAVKELLGKLEPAVSELDKELFPALATSATRIKNDPLVSSSVKRMVGDMAENFKRIRTASSSRKNVDDKLLRPMKQTHKRLVTDLAAALKLQVPEGMLTAFDDHVPSQPTIITLSPNLGSYGSRLRQRSRGGSLGGPRTPGPINRPPSLRDRLGR